MRLLANWIAMVQSLARALQNLLLPCTELTHLVHDPDDVLCHRVPLFN